MPNEPPSWRARLISPAACCASLGLRLRVGHVVDRREQEAEPERRG